MAQFRTDTSKLDNSHLITRYEVMGLMETLTPSTTMLDAYGNMRASEGINVFTSQRIGAPAEKFNHITVGGGDVVYNANNSSFFLNVGTSSGDSVIRESTNVIPFQPGKSTKILISFIFNEPKENLVQRVGFFDEKNGVFLEYDGNNLSFVVRSFSTGEIRETRTLQENWNFDRMDGTGYSAQVSKGRGTFDPSIVNILWFDMASFSVSNIRAGFLFNGKMMPAHIFSCPYDNGCSINTLMTSLCLPIRFEIYNKGITSSESSVQQINAAGISEGGFELNGINDGAGRGFTIADATNLAVAGQDYPLISYRLKSNRRNNVVIPNNFHIYVDSNATVSYRVWFGAVSSGGTWESRSANRHIEFNIGITDFVTANGRLVQGGFVTSKDTIKAGTGELRNLNYILGRYLNGTTQEVILSLIPTQANIKVLTKADWIELV
jgi:hypothetical protein